jgi:hypothetical protein
MLKAYRNVFPRITNNNQNFEVNNQEYESDEISDEINDILEEESIQPDKNMKKNKPNSLSPPSSKPIKTEIDLTEEMARKLNKNNRIPISSLIKVEKIKNEVPPPLDDSKSNNILLKNEPVHNNNFLNQNSDNNNNNKSTNMNTPKMDVNFLNQQNIYNYPHLQRNWDLGKLDGMNSGINPYYYLNQAAQAAAMRNINYQEYTKMYIDYIKSLQTKMQ